MSFQCRIIKILTTLPINSASVNFVHAVPNKSIGNLLLNIYPTLDNNIGNSAASKTILALIFTCLVGLYLLISIYFECLNL